MNILHVIATMDPSSGGPCQGVRNAISVVKSQDCQNEVVCLDDPAASFLGSDPFVIHALGPGKSSWRYSSHLIPWLRGNLPRFDVVIIRGLWQYHGYAVQKIMQELKNGLQGKDPKDRKLPKLFVMPHGMLDPYFQRAVGRKLKAIRNWFYWKFIEEKVVNNADGLLFTCEDELLLAREPFRPYSPKKEINVGYGIAEPPPFIAAMAQAFSKKCPEVEGYPYFLFLSRIHEKKGVDLLIKAYANLVKKTAYGSTYERSHTIIPKLVIAGPGLELPYGQKLQQYVQATPVLRNAVYFPGMLTGEAKWGAFYGSKAFVLPSHQENFGIAIVEAMACSKPVLISNQVNIWREIEAAGGGIVRDDTLEGTQSLLESWERLTDDKQLFMGRKARLTYENNFAIQKTVHNLLEAVTA